MDRRVPGHVAPGARRPAPHAHGRRAHGSGRADGAGDAGLFWFYVFTLDGAPALLLSFIGTRLLGRAERRALF